MYFVRVTELPEDRVAAEFLGVVNAEGTIKIAHQLPPEARRWSMLTRSEYALQQRAQAGWQALAQAHPKEFRTWREKKSLDWAAQAQLRAEGNREFPLAGKNLNPWLGRPGWAEEPEIKIVTQRVTDKQGGSAERPVEYGYVVYNRLIVEHYIRPFRNGSAEPRVAVPTLHGLEIFNPAEPEFVDRLGYALYTLEGLPIPKRDLSVAATTLTSRALARALPPERVVDLWLRVAPYGEFGSRIDMRDPRQRCIVVTPDGWRIEEVGDPTFDARAHMLPLPEPERAEPEDGDWTRVNALWEFVRLPPGEPPDDVRLLALADLVQFLLAPSSPKLVKVFAGEEGTGKSTMARFYQLAVDPSRTPLVALPQKEEEFVNLAINRAVINLDNLTYVGPDVSDAVARLSTGIGLVKRKLYSDSEEVALDVRRSVILNGITASPRAADLLRRVLFLRIESLTTRVGTDELNARWRSCHPAILGGLLDLAVLTARVLREQPPPARSSSMADFVRIGQAVAIAMGRRPIEFEYAWDRNVDLQGQAAMEDPWVTVLYDFWASRPLHADPVLAEAISSYVNRDRQATFPKGVTSQQAGLAMKRSAATLRKMQILLGSKMEHGHLVYFRIAPNEDSPEQSHPVPPVPPKPLPVDVDQLGGTRVGLEPISGSVPPTLGGTDSGSHPVPPTSPTQLSLTEGTRLGGTGGTLSGRIGVEGERSGGGSEVVAQDRRPSDDGDRRLAPLEEETLVDGDRLERRKRAVR